MEIRFPDMAEGAMRGGGEPPRERIVRTIVGWIADGTLVPGAQLPPVREAAVQFHVDKGTMARAYRLLAERGVVLRSGRATRASLVVPGRPAPPRPRSRTLAVVTSYRGEELTAGPGSGGRSVALIGGLLAAAHDGGWSVLFQHPEALADSDERPAAVVIASALPGVEALADRLAAAGIPVVAYGDLIARPDVDRVASDHAAGVAALVARLAAAGRTRIVMHLPDGPQPWIAARLAGYRAGMAAAGLAAMPPLRFAVPGPPPRSADEVRPQVLGVAGELAELLTSAQPPDAILGVSDGQAVVIAAAVKLFHRRVHEDVAVCGYDNYWPASPEVGWGLPPPFLTVDKGNERIGRALVALIGERLAGTLPPEPQVRLVMPEVVAVG